MCERRYTDAAIAELHQIAAECAGLQPPGRVTTWVHRVIARLKRYLDAWSK